MGADAFDAQIDAGKAKLTGNRDVYEQLKSTLVTLELGFEIMPGTASPIADVAAGPAADVDLSDFEAGPIELKGESAVETDGARPLDTSGGRITRPTDRYRIAVRHGLAQLPDLLHP